MPSSTPLGMRMVLVPAGSFRMGSAPGEPLRQDEELPRQVTLTRPFRIASTEVTQRQWLALMPCEPQPAEGRRAAGDLGLVEGCAGVLRPALGDGKGPPTAWPPRRSGSTPAGRAPPSRWATAAACRRGLVRRQQRGRDRTRWARRSRTPGASSTCSGTWPSGPSTPTDPTRASSEDEDPGGTRRRRRQGGAWRRVAQPPAGGAVRGPDRHAGVPPAATTSACAWCRRSPSVLLAWNRWRLSSYSMHGIWTCVHRSSRTARA